MSESLRDFLVRVSVEDGVDGPAGAVILADQIAGASGLRGDRVRVRPLGAGGSDDWFTTRLGREEPGDG